MFDPADHPVHFHFYWPKAQVEAVPGARLPVRRGRALLLTAAGLLGALAWLLASGCAHKPAPRAAAPEPPRPARIVLDYNNGWYHPADGTQSVAQVAARYQRDAGLVAQLNRMKTEQVPASSTLLYIPPHNQRAKLAGVLTRVRQNPELIPRTPWDAARQRPAPAPEVQYAVKTADPWLANKHAPVQVLESEPPAKARKPKARHERAQQPTAAAPAPAPAAAPAQAMAAVDPKLTPMPVAEPPGVEVASLGGEATLPARAAQAGEAALQALNDARQSLARGTSPAPESTATAGRGRGECAWPLEGQVVTRYSNGWRKSFHGIEIAAAVGTPVRAARGGRVLMAQEFITYGKLIVIDHGDGFATAYGYNRELKVAKGDTVQPGQVISTAGTAPRYGPQGKLFFQVRRNGLPVDPLDYLK